MEKKLNCASKKISEKSILYKIFWNMPRQKTKERPLKIHQAETRQLARAWLYTTLRFQIQRCANLSCYQLQAAMRARSCSQGLSRGPTSNKRSAQKKRSSFTFLSSHSCGNSRRMNWLAEMIHTSRFHFHRGPVVFGVDIRPVSCSYGLPKFAFPLSDCWFPAFLSSLGSKESN